MERDPRSHDPVSGNYRPEWRSGTGTYGKDQPNPRSASAGGGNAQAASGGEPSAESVPEWQRNTWIAPFPTHEYPFDEPEDAPELRDLRSEELNNRSGEFWQTQTSGYRFGSGQHTDGKPEAASSRKERRPVRKRWKALGAAALAAAVFLAVYYGLFAVRNIRVIGNGNMPAEEIIRLSGLRAGMPVFSLSSAEIEQRIEQNPLLKFRYMEKELPSTVVLCIQEREPCCWMTWNGIIYVMDKQRFVMSETENLEKLPTTLVKVDGLRIRSGAQTGQRLVLESLEQQEVFSTLFLEMKVLGCTEMIEEADLSSLGSLILTTRDGFTVSMGDSRNIHAKLRSMLLTRDELLRRDYRGGVINVTLPETPVFSPNGI